MTPSRRTISRGALLVALMAGSSAFAGGVAHADVLGGAGPVPLPAPLPAVPVLGQPIASPSPSPSPTATPTDAPAPAEQPASSSGTQGDPSSADSAGSTSSGSTPSDTAVTASNATAPEPVAAPAPVAQGPAAARPVVAQPISVARPAAPAVTTPVVSSVAGAPLAAAPQAAAHLDLATAPATNALGGLSGFPRLSVGSMQMPALPQLPGLRPMVAPETSQLTPLLAGGPSVGGVPVVRTGHSTPMQPGSTGVVLFVMASAAGAAGLARVRIYRRGVVQR